MQNTLGHKTSQPGLRGHSHDPDQDLMKQFVVARKLPTGGNLWLASFDNKADAWDDIETRPTNEMFRIINQFSNEIIWDDATSPIGATLGKG